MSVSALWNELESDVETLAADEWVVRRLNPDGVADIRVGLDGSTRNRTLLVRVAKSAISGSVEYPSSRGFEVREISLGDTPRTHTNLGVLLTDASFADIFTVLVQDVADRLAEVSSDAEAVSELVDRLRAWQGFMQQSGAEGLGNEQQRGLYGELYFLREHLLPQLGSEAAVGAWVGPLRGHQDFQWSGRACEVKTSVGKQHLKLRIANELQLDKRAMDILMLYHVAMDARQGSGETLNDIVGELRTYLAGTPAAHEAFQQSLLASGYHDVHAPRYGNTGYTIRETNFFNVVEGFPRIVEDDLRNGVGDVSYSISVAECRHFAMSAAEAAEHIGD